MDYLWLKAFHVAAVLVFIGGLFVQSVAVMAIVRVGSDEAMRDTVLLVRAWDRRITAPALLLLWGLGIAAAVEGGWFGAGWLWAKLVLVVLLSGLHGVQAGTLRRFGSGRGRPASAVGRRLPLLTIAAGAIALLAVTKPF